MPRKESVGAAYDDAADERRGSNLMLWADASFEHVRASRVLGELDERRGFSSIKMLPGSAELVGIETQELHGEPLASYLTVVRADGRVLMNDTFIANQKYEGVEIAL